MWKTICPNLRRRLAYAVILSCALYVASYFLCTHVQPSFLNTNDGPIESYRTLYLPLRYLNSSAPEYFNAPQPLKVRIVWINQGNGYTYFNWNGKEYRAFSSYRNAQVKEGQKAYIEIDYELRTYEDFSDRQIPSIVRVSLSESAGPGRPL